MRRTLLVARQEFLANVLRKGFLFATFGVPLLTIAMVVFVTSVTVNFEMEGDIGAIGFVDESGLFSETADSPFVQFADQPAAEAAFESGDVSAFFVIPADYLTEGTLAMTTRAAVPEGVQQQINSFLTAQLSAGIEPEIAERLLTAPVMDLMLLDTGRTIAENAAVTVFLLPMIFVLVFMMSMQTASGYLMSGVVEEKSNRIMEILIVSITPMQLLWGKIVGLGALALVQILIWVLALVVGLQLGQGVEALAGVVLPSDIVVVALVFYLLAFFLMGSVMAAVGAVLPSEQESRQVAGLFSLVLVVPIFFITSFILEPDGLIPLVLTLFPLTAPTAVVLRMGLSTIPPEQLLVSFAILVATTLGAAWLSGRVFAWSLLLYGKRPGLRTIARAVRRGDRLATTATEVKPS